MNITTLTVLLAKSPNDYHRNLGMSQLKSFSNSQYSSYFSGNVKANLISCMMSSLYRPYMIITFIINKLMDCLILSRVNEVI